MSPRRPPKLAAAAALAAALPLLAGCTALLRGEGRDGATGMELVIVKGGCFPMGDGSGRGEKDEQPVHEVCVSDFRMGRTEVTVGQFRKFVEATGYRTDAERGHGCRVWTGSRYENLAGMTWRNAAFEGRGQDDAHPAVCVSHGDASAFAAWLSSASGKGFRLPTEAEWEYAARDRGKEAGPGWGTGTSPGNVLDESAGRAFGERFGPPAAGYDDNHAFTAPAGSFRPNGLGLHDMAGNVWEWCSDWYGESYYGESPKDDPGGPPSGAKRVARGGSWVGAAGNVRPTDRGHLPPDERNTLVGFRVVLPAKR